MQKWDKKVKTRKQHQCFGCRGTIPAGRIVDKQEIVDAGEWTRIYLCEICRSILDHWEGDNEFSEGELIENEPEEWKVAAQEFEECTGISYKNAIISSTAQGSH